MHFAFMALPESRKHYTPEEYYALERVADYKSEYYEGEIFAMAGSTTRHARIGSNLLIELGMQLKKKQCSPFNSDQRVKVEATGLRTYPDVSVFCGPIQYDRDDTQRDTAINPTMLFEVLSESTADFDRSTKAEHYRQIPSLKGYALISQAKAHVEIYQRQADGSWKFTEASGTGNSVILHCIDAELDMSELYAGVEFDEMPPLRRIKEDPVKYAA